MTTLSKAALIAALMLGAGSLTVAAPALAKKKEEAPAAPKYGEAFRKPALAAQTAIQAKNYDAATAPLAEAESLAISDDEKYLTAHLRLSYENGKLALAAAGDPKAIVAGRIALLPSLNAIIDNPKTPSAELITFLEFRGATYFDSKKYAEAVADLARARELGSTNQDVSLQIMKAKAESGDAIGAAAELQSQIDREKAAGRKVPENWYNYVLSKLYFSKKYAESAAWSQKVVSAYPTAANWRQWVRVYMETIPVTSAKLDKSQRIDLFRLLRAAHAMADQNDYDEYAQATDDLGLNAETKAVIDEGRASGKIPAGDGLASMLAGSAKTGLSLEKSLDATEKQAVAAKTGDLAAQTADVYLAGGNNAKAIELYKIALTKPFDQPTPGSKRRYVTAAEVNTHLGIALAQSGDKEAARAAFKSVTGAPRADIAGFWLTWLDLGSAG
ncbi:MAG: hypothetical protein K2X59_01620 [Sphingomonas sp.]|nr:hypothetical protein [Sphingomonas sp.]